MRESPKSRHACIYAKCTTQVHHTSTESQSAECQSHAHTTHTLCPLHISRSDAPIGLRCSRRQFGTKPSDVASAHHSHWPNGAQCVGRYEGVRLPGWYGERVLFITTLSCVVHVRLPIGRRRRAILNMFNIAILNMFNIAR